MHVAIVVLIPPHKATTIQEARSQYDFQRAFKRWPPHITLVPSFEIGDDEFSEMQRKLMSAVNNTAPFMLHLKGTGCFNHSKDVTIFASVEPLSRLAALHHRVTSQLDSQYFPSFTPHLTVGRCNKEDDLEAMENDVRKTLFNQDAVVLQWLVNGVYILTRPSLVEEPFTISGFVPFCSDQSPMFSLPYLYDCDKYADTAHTKDEQIVTRMQTNFVQDSELLVWYECPSFSFDSQNGWIPIFSRTCSQKRDTAVVMLTLNVQFDSSPDDSKRLLTELEKLQVDVLAIQEATPSFMKLLLSSPWVMNKNWHVSHANEWIHAVPENSNVPCTPFLMSRLPFQNFLCRITPHKYALVAKLPNNWITANVHLPSNKSSNPIVNRSVHLRHVMQFVDLLDGVFSAEACFIMGDFNTEERSELDTVMLSYSDCWTSASEDDGFTFDPTVNAKAYESATVKDLPRRYDRIFHRSTKIHVEKVDLFGQELAGGPISDHYGMIAWVALKYPEAEDGHIELLNDDSFKDILSNHRVVPSTDDSKKLATSLHNLTELLTSVGMCLVLPAGSYALGVHTTSSDIDVICVSYDSVKNFLDALKKAVSAKYGAVITRDRLVRSVIRVVSFVVDGTEFDVQLCSPAASFFDWFDKQQKKNTVPSPFPVNQLKSSLYVLNAWRETERTIERFKSMGVDDTSWRLCIRFIRFWAEMRGVYDSSSGFLSTTWITELVLRACQNETITCTHQMLNLFFDRCDITTDLFTYHTPRINITEQAHSHSRRYLLAEIKEARLHKPIPSLSFNVDAFLAHFPNFIQVYIASSNKRKFMGMMTAAKGWAPKLLKNMSSTAPSISVRYWPCPFQPVEATGDDGWKEMSLLLGVEKMSTPTELSEQAKKNERINFENLLQRYQRDISNGGKLSQSDEDTIQDPELVCSVELRTKKIISQLGLQPVQQVYQMDMVDNEEHMSESDADERTENDSEEDTRIKDISHVSSSRTTSTPPSKSRTKSTKDIPENENRRLTPSNEIMNRLVWDPTCYVCQPGIHDWLY
jgi:2'-5' RNA ligase/endonuclease/exonuclease/phosphatase family metal-dependent hydrolase